MTVSSTSVVSCSRGKVAFVSRSCVVSSCRSRWCFMSVFHCSGVAFMVFMAVIWSCTDRFCR